MTNGLGLGDAYDATIGRIKAQKGDRARLGMVALMWISHSERPLKVDEICHALAVDLGSTRVNTKNAPSIRTVLGCCQGLANIDEGSSTIRLVHFTLKEYLSGHAELFDRPHSKIAETCLTYLNFQAVKDLLASPTSDNRNTPFLRYSPLSLTNIPMEFVDCSRCPWASPISDHQGTSFLRYSSLYWGTHMRMELSDRSRYLALDLLDKYDNHISARLLWESTIEQCLDVRKPFSALHCVSYFGIAEVAIDLISTKGCDVNERDGEGLTPLMWAAKYGHEEVVKLLLQQKHTQPDMLDTQHGRTALSWAAGNGNEGVVRLFLSLLFADPGRVGRIWGIPQVMSALFRGKSVNPDSLDNYGRTPLWRAARNGHDGVMKLLLERGDVNPDMLDNESRTPLLWAIWGGHYGIVWNSEATVGTGRC